VHRSRDRFKAILARAHRFLKKQEKSVI